MTHLYAFLAGIAVMFLSGGCFVYAMLRGLERPEVRLTIMAGILDGIEPYFPAIAVIDVEGTERLIRFPALRHSMLRIARGWTPKTSTDVERHYDA